MIYTAFTDRLQLLTPVLPIAGENWPYEPQLGVPYQRVMLMPADTVNPAIDQRTQKLQGLFRVLLYYPRNEGEVAAQTRADLTVAHYYAGLVIGDNIRIAQTPSKAQAIEDQDRYIVPVSIRYISFFRA